MDEAGAIYSYHTMDFNKAHCQNAATQTVRPADAKAYNKWGNLIQTQNRVSAYMWKTWQERKFHKLQRSRKEATPRVTRSREEESWSWLPTASRALESKSLMTVASVEDSPLDTASEELLTTSDSGCPFGETWFWFSTATLLSSSVVSQFLTPEASI